MFDWSLNQTSRVPAPRTCTDSYNHFRSSTADQQKPTFLTLGKLVFVIKNITRDKMADLDAVFGHVRETFGIRELNAY